jgi:acyl-CoA thioesterase FadM
MSWLETYRGTVYRWEVDNVDHFTVAFYFARFEDATQMLLHTLGLDPVEAAGVLVACVTVDCQVQYRRELRVGDIFHIRSGVRDVGDDGLGLVHEVIDSDDGTVCTTVQQAVALVEWPGRTRRSLTPAQRQAALARRVEPPAAADAASPPPPPSDAGLVDAALDAIKPSEVDGLGEASLSAYVHRFSAANAQLLAAFGMTPAYMRDEHRGYSTFEFRLRFPGAVRPGDLVRVRSGLVHVGNSSVRIAHRMQNVRTGRLVSTLEQSGVHLDLDARRPAPLPAPLRQRAVAMLARGDADRPGA